MTAPRDLAHLDATAQAEMVANGEVAPAELVDAAARRIEALNPALNAVIWSDVEAAISAAEAGPPDGPFRGVPFLIKDIGATQEGLPYWVGNRALKAMDHRSAADTELGRRFRNAGLVTLGKTNLPELGSCPSTQPLSCGPTNNPWDLERSPAGSSGGSAAAVAAGLVPIAHANDGGGSTRLPAAWCGLVGLKTSRGRVPNPASTSRLVSELVVTRTVRDTARILDAVEGHTEADLFHLPRPERPYADELGRPVAPLRIGMITDGGVRAVDRECVTATEAVAQVLEEMGHHIEPVGSEALLGGDSSVNGRLWMGGIARRVAGLAEMAGRDLGPDEVEPYNWTSAVRGRDLSAADWMAAEETQQRWAASFIEWMRSFDLLLTPTAGCPPMRTDDLWPDQEKPWKISSTYALIGLFTLPFNVTGQPALSLPLQWSGDDLPIGIQLVAHMGREDLLVRLATQLEETLPWSDRHASLISRLHGSRL